MTGRKLPEYIGPSTSITDKYIFRKNVSQNQMTLLIMQKVLTTLLTDRRTYGHERTLSYTKNSLSGQDSVLDFLQVSRSNLYTINLSVTNA